MPYSEEVDKLLRQGAKGLGEKDYEKAVEAYGQACGLNQEETGEIDPELFLLYGKALYESGVSQSDVLGGQEITSEKIEEAKGSEDNEDGNFQFNDLAAEEAAAVENVEGEDEEEEQAEEEDDEEQDEEQGEEGEEDNKSDMELAWEILEVSRSLFEERLKENESEKANLTIPYLKSDKDKSDSVYITTLKSLSEVYDLLGEISLESEHFQQAANDLEHCLELRTQLYDAEYSSLVGESHFKLSLALEFCLDDDDAKDKARKHIKSAIQILKNDTGRNLEKKKDNEEIIQSLQDRYDEIESNAEEAINQQKQDMLEGILGSSKGTELLSKLSGISSSAPAPAPATVNDLTSMVKKRKPNANDSSAKRQRK